MKRLWLLMVLIIGLTGCAGSAAPSKGECKKGICIRFEVDEPVEKGKPVTIHIIATTEEDVQDLVVSLMYFDKEIVVDAPDTKEAGQVAWQNEQEIDWMVTTTANQPVVFTRKVHLPVIEEGVIWFLASAITTEGVRVTQSLNIYFDHERGEVYYSGTPLPTNQNVAPTQSESDRMTEEAWPTPTRGITIYPTQEPTRTLEPQVGRPTSTLASPYPVNDPNSFTATPVPIPYP